MLKKRVIPSLLLGESEFAHGLQTDLHQTATVILSMIYQKMTKGGILSSSSSSPTSSNTCSSLIKSGDDALQRPVLPAWEIMEALPFILEAILTACVHGKLSSRDLTTGLSVVEKEVNLVIPFLEKIKSVSCCRLMIATAISQRCLQVKHQLKKF